MYLVDTNIFLAILLKESTGAVCKQFLSDNGNQIAFTDYSLHSIGTILFRKNRLDLFTKFVQDFLRYVPVVTLSRDQYAHLENVNARYGLDFDDAYQYLVAESTGRTLVTMDKHFQQCSDIQVRFLP
jgi:predicted nucleic acid-binding protein